MPRFDPSLRRYAPAFTTGNPESPSRQASPCRTGPPPNDYGVFISVSPGFKGERDEILVPESPGLVAS